MTQDAFVAPGGAALPGCVQGTAVYLFLRERVLCRPCFFSAMNIKPTRLGNSVDNGRKCEHLVGAATGAAEMDQMIAIPGEVPNRFPHSEADASR